MCYCWELIYHIISEMMTTIAIHRDEYKYKAAFHLVAAVHAFVRKLLLHPPQANHQELTHAALDIGRRFEALFGANKMVESVHRLLDMAVLNSRFNGLANIAELFIGLSLPV